MPLTLTPAQMWELMLLSLCVWREARNQDYLGKIAVAWSIRNRVLKPGKTWWGDDWEEVILKPYQFSSFNPNDPNANKLPGDPTQDKSWDASLQAATLAYMATGNDPTDGATHYYNPKVVAEPAWAKTGKFVKTIGDHRFYIAS